jgi:uncharacterized protein (DUF58 family)
MTGGADRVFPLVPSRRGRFVDVAGSTSRRRGAGGDIASSRPYRRGDAMRLVDWAASARLSTARGTDEFVVRDHFAEDALRVLVVVDRSRSMALFPHWLPWLDKPAAVREAGRAIVASGAAANALIGFAAAGARRAAFLSCRRGGEHRRAIEHHLEGSEPDGPPDSIDRALELLSRSDRSVRRGTFVFLISDFLAATGPARLGEAVTAGWDVVPVVVQDPTWERSFPEVPGVTLPLVDPNDGAPTLVRLSRREARARREANELRAARLDEVLRGFGLDPVTITSSDSDAVHAAFVGWAKARNAGSRGSR